MKRCLLLFCFSLLCFGAAAQEDGQAAPVAAGRSLPTALGFSKDEMSVLVDVPDVWGDVSEDVSSAGGANSYWSHWRLGADVTTFFRDAEFFLPYTKGYTASGFFLTPYAKRVLGRYAQLTLGVQLAGVAGYEGLRRWQPVVRLEYMPHRNWRLVMGSIYGALSHGLYEPMFDRERFIYDHQEEGVQILGSLALGSCRLQTDTWVHWEELLEPWQPTQERFTLGSNNRLDLLSFSVGNAGGEFGVGVPLSFVGCHRGGQFTALDTCIQTLFNENVGLRLTWSGGPGQALAVDVPFFFYQDMSPTKCMAYDDGWGLWPQLRWDCPLRGRRRATGWRGVWQLQLQAGYWYGHQFVAPRGSFLFQSISWHDAAFATPEREMATGRVAIENTYGKLAMGVDAEFYYDLRLRGLDLAVGLYLRCRL